MLKNFALGAAPIPGHEGYLATRGGKILSTKGWQRKPIRLLVGQQHREGHLRVAIAGHRCKECGGKSNKLMFVHALILETFVGPRPPGGVCRHLNSIPDDNRAANLAWGTSQENMDDRARRGLYHRGERNTSAKLTDAEAAEMRGLRSQGWTLLRLARHFRVSQSQAGNICAGRQRR